VKFSQTFRDCRGVCVCVCVWGGINLWQETCGWKHLLHTETDIGTLTFGSPEESVL